MGAAGQETAAEVCDLSRAGAVAAGVSISGDAPRRVYLRGELPEGNLKLREKTLDAGPVPCGLPHTLVMQIKNHGTRDSAFKVTAVPTFDLTQKTYFKL